ncbi:MAG: type I DNA topoisomerase [Bacteroidia bacterium]|nr:type I DNA topoisomerase [Bacteroidia bacterium]
MSKNLVIVESPAKAKTIEGFLGKDYTVKSSFGHVRDLVKKGLGVDVNKKFLPNYEISEDKVKVVGELKKMAQKADTVWLATDEDREGEAISWHLFETLGLNNNNTKRIVFHEITPSAIKNAIDNPRNIDINLVDAQQARRILDRLVGFELSPVLWKKVKPPLSAGRVQSVAVRLIVERERDIISFTSESYYKIAAIFTNSKNDSFKADIVRKIASFEEAQKLLEAFKDAQFKVADLQTSPAKKSPAAPFTTSTLQQEASRKLGFSVGQTMSVAQRLYESGKITYMRTDSVNLSETALNASKDEIIQLFGKEYHHKRQFKTKSKSAQEAHEAIRPTYFNVQKIDGDNQEKKLYDLIWKRTVASQMSDAQLEKTNVLITNDKNKENFNAVGEMLKFEGFLKLYIESTDEENTEEQEGMLPTLKTNETLNYAEIKATQKFTYHQPRYTEASLVKKLEELGIGRPSTYAPTISTIQKRGYVVKEDREGTKKNFKVILLKNKSLNTITESMNSGAEKAKLFPTDIGMVVTDFLLANFKEIMDYNFTASVEKEFDEIAEGKLKWQKMLDSFYKPFHNLVENTIEYSDRASGERNLGKDPVSGKNVYARIGRFGPMIQIGENNDETDKPRFAGLNSNQRLDTITLDEALKLFILPRVVGNFENTEMVAAAGRFGPYIRHNGMFYSLAKTDDPLSITQERAIELILAKRKKDSERVINTFEEQNIQILNGRWGPYIAANNKNYKIPKGSKDAKDLTLQDCQLIISDTDASNADSATPKATKQSNSGTSKRKEAPVKSAAQKTAAKRAEPKKTSTKKNTAKKANNTKKK